MNRQSANTDSTSSSSSSASSPSSDRGEADMDEAQGRTNPSGGAFNAGRTQAGRLPPHVPAVASTGSNLSDEVVIAAAATVAAMAAPKATSAAASGPTSSQAARKRPPPSSAASASKPAAKKCARTSKAPSTHQTSSAEERWEDMFTRLLRYKQAHGNCQVPNRYENDPKLGAWVSTQRRHYRVAKKDNIESSSLTNDRIKRLEEAGFEWTGINPRYLHWDMRFGELLEFKDRFGHVNIPINWPENVKLANWTSTQRQEYKNKLKGKKSRLDDRRIEQLNRVGFAWELQRGGRKRHLVVATQGSGQQEEEEQQESEHSEDEDEEDDDNDDSDEQSDQTLAEGGDETQPAEAQDMGQNRYPGSVSAVRGQPRSENDEEDSKPPASEVNASSATSNIMLSVGEGNQAGPLADHHVQQWQQHSYSSRGSAAGGGAQAAPSPTLAANNNETIDLLLSLAQQYQVSHAGVQSQTITPPIHPQQWPTDDIRAALDQLAALRSAQATNTPPMHPQQWPTGGIRAALDQLAAQSAQVQATTTPPMHPQQFPTVGVRGTLDQLAALQSAQSQIQAQAAITAYNTGRITGILEAMQQQQNAGRVLPNNNLSLIQRLALFNANGSLNANGTTTSDSSSSAGHQHPSLLRAISNQVYTSIANINRVRAEGAELPMGGSPDQNGRDPNRGNADVRPR